MADRDDQSMTIWGFVKGFGKLLIGLLLVLQGLVGLAVLLIVVGVAASVMNGVAGDDDEAPKFSIQNGSALVIDPVGVLVEEAPELDPFAQIIEEAYGFAEPLEVETHDLARAIRKAKTDKRIAGLVLKLSGLQVSSLSASKAHYLANEIAAFRESGKPVIAVGDGFSQEQYLIAAHADEIVLHDFGAVFLPGYGVYNAYLKGFLDKLKITANVFRVGTFKSAVEPFLRDDMSPEAKEANRAFLDQLWREYARSAEQARGLEQGAIEGYANDFTDVLRGVEGDFAAAARAAGLVDRLVDRRGAEAYLIERFSANDDGALRQVGWRRYLAAVGAEKDDGDPNVAVVKVVGAIVDGEAALGEAAGGDTVAALLKKAREDKNVKAVVLRIDSPGGSVFGSEIIRDEVIALKSAGKPVVASMGSLAASGGYWVAAPADEIWAAPTTITGSIGIFGFLPTFERAAAEWGVTVDGVGTTAMSPALATGLAPLPEPAADAFQQSVEFGYERFLKVVADGRGLDRDYVDSVGQGRVWDGETARALKLVDHLGEFDQAVAAAAARAGLEKYDVVEMTESKTPFERFIENLAVDAAARMSPGVAAPGPASKLARLARREAAFFEQFNDPNAAYARCLACD